MAHHIRHLPISHALVLAPLLVAATPLAELQWTDAAAFVRNSGLNSSVAKESPFARLPLAAKSGAWCTPACPVRSSVWVEGQNGAGLYVGFQSDANDLWLNATLLEKPQESQVCSAVCGSGLDLYAFDERSHAWRWVDTTKNSNGGGWKFDSATILRSMFKNNARGGAHVGSGKLTRYRLHLPIYNGLTQMAIGVPAPAKVIADPADDLLQKAPVLWYGTSITNGHVASRPGMIFTNALSRMLGRDVINLGFGGNGMMEQAVGAVIAQVQHAAAVVIDCNWNMNASQIATNAPLLVKQLRAEWSPTKPIVLAEGTSAGSAWIVPSIRSSREANRAALLAAYTQLSKDDNALHYVQGDQLIGKSGVVDIPTAQGTHPDDLGHHMIAQFYSKFLPKILAGAAPVVPASSDGATPQDMAPGLDDAIAACSANIHWTDARTLGVGGREEWTGLQRENWWDRFPLAAKADVTSGGGGKGIWGLSKCTPSEFVGFALSGGSASQLYVRYNIDDPSGVNPSGGQLSIMPPLGRNGVDLYAQVKETQAWVWAGNACTPFGSGDDVSTVCSGLSREGAFDTGVASRFMLYLPLWRAYAALIFT